MKIKIKTWISYNQKTHKNKENVQKPSFDKLWPPVFVGKVKQQRTLIVLAEETSFRCPGKWEEGGRSNAMGEKPLCEIWPLAFLHHEASSWGCCLLATPLNPSALKSVLVGHFIYI